MTSSRQSAAQPLNWKKSLLWAGLAVACFNAAYASVRFPVAGLLIFGYAFALVRLTDQATVRRAFYFGLAVGYICAATQGFFFWKIFNIAAVVLWLVFAFWVGLFTALSCGALRRWGNAKAAWLIPVFWTGIEYFRSELYYLKFSWLNVGYAFPFGSGLAGMYGCGFLIFAIVSLYCHRHLLSKRAVDGLIILTMILILWALLLPAEAYSKHKSGKALPVLSLTGVQMEFPPSHIIPKLLDQALAKNTNAQIFVLSEYTLDAGVPDALKDWCRANSRFLIVGGKDVLTNDVYYNTAFVVGTNGEIVFKQAKSVPIQFFHDGLPAPSQRVWDSPWGKIGICICYDLSYTRVTDELVRQGAQLLIVPAMDVMEWGRHQHELHFRVAPVRAAEYGIPIFRLASSGISQAVERDGRVIAQTRMPGNGDILSTQLRLPAHGSLPLDRFLAPLCTAATGAALGVLLFLNWRERRNRPGK